MKHSLVSSQPGTEVPTGTETLTIIGPIDSAGSAETIIPLVIVEDTAKLAVKPSVFIVCKANAFPEKSHTPIWFFESTNVSAKFVFPSGDQIAGAVLPSANGPTSETSWMSSDAE